MLPLILVLKCNVGSLRFRPVVKITHYGLGRATILTWVQAVSWEFTRERTDYWEKRDITKSINL